ncbi:MAG: hypothetical protein QOJ63_2217 [Solirubrobacteraceae bacterium]|nr:hypothetical protein [Solirubrobacteraceae bacterium]
MPFPTNPRLPGPILAPAKTTSRPCPCRVARFRFASRKFARVMHAPDKSACARVALRKLAPRRSAKTRAARSRKMTPSNRAATSLAHVSTIACLPGETGAPDGPVPFVSACAPRKSALRRSLKPRSAPDRSVSLKSAPIIMLPLRFLSARLPPRSTTPFRSAPIKTTFAPRRSIRWASARNWTSLPLRLPSSCRSALSVIVRATTLTGALLVACTRPWSSISVVICPRYLLRVCSCLNSFATRICATTRRSSRC